jgi:hypothetical protein
VSKNGGFACEFYRKRMENKSLAVCHRATYFIFKHSLQFSEKYLPVVLFEKAN